MRFIQTMRFASLFGVLALVPVSATKAADPVKNERGEERQFKKDWRHEGVESKDENWLKEFARQQAEGQSKDDLNKWNDSPVMVQMGKKYVLDHVDVKVYKLHGTNTKRTWDNKRSFEAWGEVHYLVYYRLENR
jgi:hypothetical protein